MKPAVLITLFIFFSSILYAQTDTTVSADAAEKKDTSKSKIIIRPQIPPRTLIIKMKDLDRIRKPVQRQFIIIDDTSHFTEAELESGLSEKELKEYRKNKNEIKELLKPPVSEEEKYPGITDFRNILDIAKKAGVIIILILSLL
jgi:hypothetical protein